MRSFKRTLVNWLVGTTMVLFPIGLWAEPSQEVQALIAAHRQAAAEAQQKVSFHEEMARKYQQGRGGAKIDMVGHCRYWANTYRTIASREEQAAKELEGKSP